MPAPTGPIAELGQDLIDELHSLFGVHAGLRPAHAKGLLLTGIFTPSTEASKLSSAPHFAAPSTPVTTRFSSSTGLPTLPDTAPEGQPRGLAIRFELASTPRRVHTDIVAHSTPLFPVRTGEEFLGFLRAAKVAGADGGAAMGKFVEAHPHVAPWLAAAQAPAFPASLATDRYHSVSAFKFVAADGTEAFIKYIVEPTSGVEHLNAADVAGRGPNFLYEELPRRLAAGPVRFWLLAQVAQEGDAVDDPVARWPADRRVVVLGELVLDALVPADAQAGQQQRLVFDPVPRVQGIEPTKDALFDIRASLYYLSGMERRAAKTVEKRAAATVPADEGAATLVPH